MTQSTNTKSILITGGTLGIGEALVSHFLHAGYHVTTCSRHVEKESDNLVCLKGDISDHSFCNLLVKECEKRSGLQVVINNAAIYHRGEIESISPECWEYIFKVNVHGVFGIIRASLPIMKKNNIGKIINITSGITTTPIAKRSLYASSKSAVNTITRVAAVEVENFNIQINAICPGLVSTRMDLDKKAKKMPESVVPTIEHVLSSKESGCLYRNLEKLPWGDHI